jgi:hypothetical protein
MRFTWSLKQFKLFEIHIPYNKFISYYQKISRFSNLRVESENLNLNKLFEHSCAQSAKGTIVVVVALPLLQVPKDSKICTIPRREKVSSQNFCFFWKANRKFIPFQNNCLFLPPRFWASIWFCFVCMEHATTSQAIPNFSIIEYHTYHWCWMPNNLQNV